MLHKKAFRSKHKARMYSVAYRFMLPWIWSVNQLLSMVIRTTDESRNEEDAPCYERCVILLFTLPVCLVLIIFFSPFALFGFLARVCLSGDRAPYMYSYADTPSRVNVNECIWVDLSSKHFFKVGVVDTCLMPECMSRLNNLRNVQTRAVNLGRRIINSQVRPSPRIFVQSPSDSELKTYSINPRTQANPMSLFSVGEGNQLDISETDVSCVTYTNIRPEETSFYTAGSEKIPDSYEELQDETQRCNGKTSATSPESDGNSLKDLRESYGGGVQQRASVTSVPDIVPKDVTEAPPIQESLGSNSTPNLDCSIQLEFPRNAYPEARAYSFSGGSLMSSPPQRHHGEASTPGDLPTPSDHAVNINFPAGLDFVCFQEVFEKRATHKLIKTLHLWFSHIIYDVGRDSWRTNRHFLNSGLLFASRYPILDASFESFGESQNEDRAVSKGLLMVKVQVGKTREGNPVVGYIAVSQLQAEQEGNIRSSQLDSILNWLSSFHSNTSAECCSELVAFDLLCGNFNFDNISPGDMPDWSHPVFLIYHDPCRQRPGLDRPWTVGTILRKKHLQDEEICTPEGLQSALEDPKRRSNYLEDAEAFESGADTRWGTSDGGRLEGIGRRRVDYILYSNHRTHMQQICEEYSFVSQLATLTDHIPLCMTFSTAIGPAAMQEWPQAVTPDSDGSHSCKVMYETTV